jgi:hypothetical protein
MSAVLHAGLLVLLGLTVTAAPPAVSDQPLRAAGIVLKPREAPGEYYDGAARPLEAADRYADQAADGHGSAADASSALLPERPEVDLGVLPLDGPPSGATALQSGGIRAVTEMTGGARSHPALPGNYARTRIFGVEAEGANFAYVFDRSGSMDGWPLAAAKAQLLASLGDLSEIHQFYIVFYHHEPRVFSPGGTPGRLVFATPANKEAARQFVANIQADGGTDHVQALAAALRLAPDVVFLLTDGEEKDDLTEAELRYLDRVNRRPAAIHVIQFSPAPLRHNNLVRLAQQTGGHHRYVNPSASP